MPKTLVFCLLFILGQSLTAQTIITGDSVTTFSTDSSKAPVSKTAPGETLVRKHSPKTATLLSTFIPGAGQVYNKKNWWWKVPVIYGVGGALVYGVVFYNNEYKGFRDAYKYRVENNATKNGDAYYDKFETPTLLNLRDSYRESRDQCIIGLAAVYALQIIDACVEAHFFDFNVSDDLSLNVQPLYVPNGAFASTGVQLNLKFR